MKDKPCICEYITWHKTGREIGYETECKNKAKFRVRHKNPVNFSRPDIDKLVCGVHVKPYKRNRLNIFVDCVIEEIDIV